MDRILITGANGFIGRHLLARLGRDRCALTLAHRSEIPQVDAPLARSVAVGEIGPGTDWRPALEGCAAVVHLAGHVPRHRVDPVDFHVVNDQGTARLVEQALEAGVSRFILLSSVAAVVEDGDAGVVDERTAPSASLSAYGASKRAAEAHVAAFAAEGRTGVSIRPPLVYAADAQGRWRMLMRLAASGLPLPFATIHNRRSLLAVENLTDAVHATLTAPGDASGAYFVADEPRVSIGETITWLREGMGRKPHLFPASGSALRALMRFAGLGAAAQGLFGDLEIDSSLFRKIFRWNSAIHPRDAITKCGARFRSLGAP